jgi:hypothetical protein
MLAGQHQLPTFAAPMGSLVLLVVGMIAGAGFSMLYRS